MTLNSSPVRLDFHESFASVERVAVPLEDGRLRLRIYVGSCSVEVFAQDGLATLTDQIFRVGSSVGHLAPNNPSGLGGI